jgi:uncharacterized protein YdhG (YjbR/CyaY superfamily)
MNSIKNKILTIDEYISGYPKNVQVILNNLRKIVKEVAPEAKETINYQIPTFQLKGNLVHFAAYSKHIGFYPTPSAISAFRKELSVYQGAKGSVQFPINQPIPYKLVKRIVEYRVKENREQNI